MFTFVIAMFPTVGYIDKFRKMIETGSPEFFDIDTALILLFSNQLRFFYWIYEPYKAYLLGQAMAVFTTQIILAMFAFYYQRSPHHTIGSMLRRPPENGVLYYFQIRSVVTATDFLISVVAYAGTMFVIFMMMRAIFGLGRVCTSAILIANVMDPMVSIPRFLTIVVNRNIATSSALLLGQSFAGGWVKLGLYLFSGVAWPFVVGAVLQIVVDFVIAVSYILQRRHVTEKQRHVRTTDSEYQRLMTHPHNHEMSSGAGSLKASPTSEA
jgi:hypothetical protein